MAARFCSLAIALFVVGCAPSHRMVHQSNVQFERCHSAELTEDVDLQGRYDCWDEWIRRYAEGQPPHRVLYARERMVALAQGETLNRLPDGTPAGVDVPGTESATDATTEPGAGTAAPTAESQPGPAPAPTPETPPAPPARSPRYHGDPTCQPVCNPHWDTCIAHCDPNRMPCVQACENEYRACMRGCL